MAEAAPSEPAPAHIVIVGPMGVGKTTVGSIVAQHLRWSFVDSDQVIEALYGRRGSDIARDEGVDHLHRIEAEVLEEALGFAAPSVIAAAASVADDRLLVDRVAAHGVVLVLLACESAVLAERARDASHRRPMSRSESDDLTERRRSAVQPVANVVLDVTDLTPTHAAAQIIDVVRSRSG